MGSTDFHVFLSAVSGEFGDERRQLIKWLEEKGLHVSAQDKFHQGDTTLWRKLHDEVEGCRAVICLMGAESGFVPRDQSIPDDAPERSYTQWEFWLAWGEPPWSPPRREKIYVFFPADLQSRFERTREAAVEESERARELDPQEEHIRAVKDTGVHYDTFTNGDELIKKCLVLDLPTIPKTKPQNLPYLSLGTLFKGRKTFLERLHQQHLPDMAGRPLAIHGQGGVGKTRAAIEYALSHAKDYTALLFATADSPESLRQSKTPAKRECARQQHSAGCNSIKAGS